MSRREIPIPLEIRTASSYLAANDARRSVGLWKNARPEWARVRWPDGLVERFADRRAGAGARNPGAGNDTCKGYSTVRW